MTNMNEMMSTMMEKMMEACMANMMNQMMASMQSMMASPVVEEAPKKTEAPKMTKEEFLAMEFKAEPKSLKGLDFEPISSTVCKYNGYVPSDIWTANHLAISREYGAKWSKKHGGYKFESAVAMQNFFQCYKIKTELTDVDRHNIKVYKQEKARAKAEYYAKKAQE